MKKPSRFLSEGRPCSAVNLSTVSDPFIPVRPNADPSEVNL